MLQDSYGILSEMLVDLKHDLSDLNAQIHRNLLYIKEAESRVKFLEINEPDDYKMFSPRSMSGQFKEEIDDAVSLKVDFERKNTELYVKKEALEKRIDQLEKVLRQENVGFSALYVQEKDRQRIARDLHDTSLQVLAHLIHKVELCGMYLDQDQEKAKSELDVVRRRLKEVVEEIRNTIFDLRPMTSDDMGLKAAFERLLARVNERKKYHITSDIEDVSCENSLIALYIYRAVQEGIFNIVKHAEAEKIDFKCRVVDSVCVIDISDDGRGFCDEDKLKEDKHFGLSLMKERIELLKGKINVSSVRGEGTKIHMEIPV